MTIKELYQNIITGRKYVLADIEEKLEASWIEGKISTEEKIELLALAADNADDRLQVDVMGLIADLEQRVATLESKGVVVWVAGMVTAKGQTVLYDVDKDGVLDYCRYDGGRATTSSSPGKITGWVKTDASGNVTHTIEKDGEGNIILVPVAEPEEGPTEEPGEE